MRGKYRNEGVGDKRVMTDGKRSKKRKRCKPD